MTNLAGIFTCRVMTDQHIKLFDFFDFLPTLFHVFQSYCVGNIEKRIIKIMLLFYYAEKWI